MLNFETENPNVVKIIGACVATVMYVAAALTLKTSVDVAVGLMMGATGLLGIVGVQVKGKTP